MKKHTWTTLDNSAKIMPPTTTDLNTNVFRLVCKLKENIEPKYLQEALDKTLIEFPMFLYEMKNGIFWHYLETSDYKPLVKEEKYSICTKITSGLLFRVTYYKKRINLEVYHALSDGNGAMEFFKYLICTYLNLKKNLKLDIPLNDSSLFEKEKNDFKTFDKENDFTIVRNKKGYKFKYQKKDTIEHDLIEMHLPLDSIKKLSKKYNTTITIYLTALLIKSIINNAKVKDLKRPIGISIPVDLRSIFPSKTVKNFFYTFLTKYQAKDKNVNLKDIIKVIEKQFKETLTKENLQKKLNSYMLLEKILFIRIVPYFIKDFAMKFFALSGKKGQTCVLSNLGLIKLPEEYKDYVEYFCAYASTEELQLTICGFKNELVLSFTSHFITKEIEHSYLKELQKELNKEILVITNIKGE